MSLIAQIGADGYAICHTSVSLEDGDGTSGVGVAAAAAVSAASARAWASAASNQQRRSSQTDGATPEGTGLDGDGAAGGGGEGSGEGRRRGKASKAGFKLTASINRGEPEQSLGVGEKAEAGCNGLLQPCERDTTVTPTPPTPLTSRTLQAIWTFPAALRASCSSLLPDAAALTPSPCGWRGPLRGTGRRRRQWRAAEETATRRRRRLSAEEEEARGSWALRILRAVHY